MNTNSHTADALREILATCADPLNRACEEYAKLERELAEAIRERNGFEQEVDRLCQFRQEWMRCKTCGSVCDAKALGYRVCDGDPVTGDRNCKMEPYDPNGERPGE